MRHDCASYGSRSNRICLSAVAILASIIAILPAKASGVPNLDFAVRESQELIQISNVSPTCVKEDGFVAGPVVITKAEAEEIYVAIARALHPNSWRKYPVIFVLDGGDHWEVGQKKAGANAKFFRNGNGGETETVTVYAGGGEIEMQINKCDASTKVNFSR
jgi:hypothetical protein